MNIIHFFTNCEWNSSFIQSEAGTIPRRLARGELFMSRFEFIKRAIPLNTSEYDVYTLNEFLL